MKVIIFPLNLLIINVAFPEFDYVCKLVGNYRNRKVKMKHGFVIFVITWLKFKDFYCCLLPLYICTYTKAILWLTLLISSTHSLKFENKMVPFLCSEATALVSS